jgi:hypothetical protein
MASKTIFWKKNPEPLASVSIDKLPSGRVKKSTKLRLLPTPFPGHWLGVCTGRKNQCQESQGMIAGIIQAHSLRRISRPQRNV